MLGFMFVLYAGAIASISLKDVGQCESFARGFLRSGFAVVQLS